MDLHTHPHHHSDSILLIAISCTLPVIFYLIGVVRQNRNYSKWDLWRVICFITGFFLLGIAFSPSIENAAHHSFTIHMMQHLLIGMFAPIALAISKPVTLLLRNLNVESARKLTRIFRSPWCYWPAHPAITLLLNIGGMYVLYLTPLYSLSLQNQLVHYLVHWHFLVAGYLFTWSLIRSDPLPHHHGFWYRLCILLISIVVHALLAKLIYAGLTPGYAQYPLGEIQSAAKLMYYGGDLAEIIIAIIIFSKFYNLSATKKVDPNLAPGQLR